MTSIVFYRSVHGGFRGYEASGHAEEIEEDGFSLVCGAVSVLTQTGANALERVVEIQPVTSVGDGYLACFLPEGLNPTQWASAQIVLETVYTGLEEIARQYPQYITFQEQEA